MRFYEDLYRAAFSGVVDIQRSALILLCSLALPVCGADAPIGLLQEKANVVDVSSQRVWRKGEKVQTEGVNSKMVGGQLIPALQSRKLREAPQVTGEVPPNFEHPLRDFYLGDFNKLEARYKTLAMDCYTKHLRHIDALNKGAVEAELVHGFAYSIEAGQCISHYFFERDYRASLLSHVDVISEKCFESQEFGEIRFPVRVDRSQKSYVFMEPSLGRAALERSPALSEHAKTRLAKDFWNEAGNKNENFLGAVALEERTRFWKPGFEAEFGYERSQIRGPSGEGHRVQGQMNLRISLEAGVPVVEIRTMGAKDWNPWEKLNELPRCSTH